MCSNTEMLRRFTHRTNEKKKHTQRTHNFMLFGENGNFERVCPSADPYHVSICITLRWFLYSVTAGIIYAWAINL